MDRPLLKSILDGTQCATASLNVVDQQPGAMFDLIRQRLNVP
jgi:hypothetical protein